VTTFRGGWWQGASDPERALAKAAKEVGQMRSEYLLKRVNGVHEQAKRERWPTERLEKAIDDIEQLANEIWGQLQ